MLYIAFRDLHQIGDQVIAASELHVDLGEGVLERVARRHQPVVGGDEDDREPEEHQQNDPTHGQPPKMRA